jgi:RNA polymerase sigma factor (sigma-70 family)
MSSKREIRIHLHPPKNEGDYTVADMYKEYRDPLVRIFDILLKEKRHWSEDLTHETFVRVIEFETSFNRVIDPTMIGALLSYFAKQAYVQYKRDQGEADLRNYDDDPFLLFETEIDSKLLSCLNPEDMCLKDERVQRMFTHIGRLRKIDQDILELIFVDNNSMRDAADILKLSYPNLRKRVQRLREVLGAYEQGEKDDMA